MTDLLRQTAELLADFFLRVIGHEAAKWSFRRGRETVIVTVERVPDSVEYNDAMTYSGWVVESNS